MNGGIIIKFAKRNGSRNSSVANMLMEEDAEVNRAIPSGLPGERTSLNMLHYLRCFQLIWGHKSSVTIKVYRE